MEGWAIRERTRLDIGEIAWDRFGDGPPVVLVHGTPSSSFLWRGVVARLSDRFSVYVFDLLGYGASERREDLDVSISVQGRVLAAMLEEWGLDAPALVGHDIGAAVSLRAHLIEKRSADRIVLVDGVALNPWNTSTTLHIREHLAAYRSMPTHLFEAIVGAHLRTAVHRPIDDQAFLAYLSQWKGEAGQGAYLRKIEQWSDGDVGDLEPLLPDIRVPVRLIWGREDRWLDPSVAQRLKELIPRSDLRWISDAGHFAPEDDPEAVARELVDALND
jgi:pimeloyl-ACP methyl ester carboxylesterase